MYLPVGMSSTSFSPVGTYRSTSAHHRIKYGCSTGRAAATALTKESGRHHWQK